MSTNGVGAGAAVDDATSGLRDAFAAELHVSQHRSADVCLFPGAAIVRLRRIAIVLAVGALFWLGIAAAAQAAIVYRCAPNLCRINSDGSGQAQLTSDGAAAAYHGASLSHDGTRMVFTRDTADLFAADGSAQNPVGPISRSSQIPQISFDGTKLADMEDYSAVGYGLIVCTFATTGSTDRTCGGHALFPTWTPDGQLVVSQQGPGARDLVCVYAIASGGSGCQRTIAADPANNLEQSAVSPDGTTLAVIAVVPGSASAPSGHLVLYDMASGALLRTLTSGPGDASPAWSPDGTRLVFDRGSALFVIASTGAPGSEHQLVAGGDTPTWGGPDNVPAGSGGGGGATGGGGTGALAPNSAFVAVGNPSVNPKTGAITFTESVTDPGTFSWRLSFQNGRFGVFAAAKKTKCKTGHVRLKGKCRPSTIIFGTGSKTVAKPGTFSLTVTPSRSAATALKKALTKKNGLSVTAVLSYQSARGGSPVSHTVVVNDKLTKTNGKKP